MGAKWEIEMPEFLDRLGRSEESFVSDLCLPDVHSVQHIVPLRHLKYVHAMIPMRNEILRWLVSRIKTMDGQEPFKRASIEIHRVAPGQLLVGQRFVYRENYQALLETLSDLLRQFAVGNGFSDLGAHFIFGIDKDDIPSLACYMPPLIEQHSEGLVVMDGIHRGYVAKQLGATENAIFIKGVSVPFPCELHEWSDVCLVGLVEKPVRYIF